MLAYLGTLFGVSFVFGFLGVLISGGNQDGAAYFLVQGIANLISYALSGWLIGGLYRMAIAQVRGEPVQVGDLFKATDVIVPMILATMLIGIGTMFGLLFCIVPGIILSSLWMLTYPLIADQNMAPVEAMTRSLNALKGQMGSAVGLSVVSGFVASLGILGCGIGLLVTAPIAVLTWAIVYNDFFGSQTSSEEPPSYYSQRPQSPPPPPGQMPGL
jgi:uncharacterized membrane protein